MMQPKYIGAMLAMSFITACTTHTPVERITLPVANNYHTEVAAGPMPIWQEMLRDPLLQQLVQLALDNNRDLREAALNVATVKAQYQLQDAARGPVLDASMGTVRQRQTTADTPHNAIQQQSSASLGISAFELDLFGRLRALSEAAQARYLASIEGQRAARLALIGAVAEAYLEFRLASDQTRLTKRNMLAWRKSLQLTEQLYVAHQRSGLDIAQSAGQVALAEAELQSRERAQQMARNQLELLLGTALPTELEPNGTLDEDPILTSLPAGLPADLLTRRPDIMQAEQMLTAASAEVSAARAAFLPRIALTSSFGFSSTALNALFSGSQRSWSFNPQITQPIFHSGQLRAEQRLTEVRKSIAVVQYERAIQNAFREVNDALVSNLTFQRQVLAQRRVVEAAMQREHLQTLRYHAGLDNRLDLLEAQRQSYSAESTLLDLRRDHLKSSITLYKALGGGVN